MHIKELYSRFLECKSVCTDTRKTSQDSIFFALKGPNFNANSFAKQALEAGSSYAVIDDEKYFIDERTLLVDDSLIALQELAKHHRDQLNIPVIGITGSNGKTTSKELIYAVLSEKYKVCATEGNLNNHIGVPLSLLRIDEQSEIAIIEMGANHAGEIEFLCTLSKPNYALITNIGKAHLEGFGNLETIIETKTALYRSIEKSNGSAFVNSADSLLMEHSQSLNRILYPSEEGISSKSINGNSPFLEFDILENGNKIAQVKTQLIGSYNLDNALAAICIGNYFKLDIAQIKNALESYSPSNNRSQWKETEYNHLILDAYNANPSSTRLALDNFLELDIDNKLIILGDMLELGENEQEEHQLIVDQIIESNQKAIIIGPLYNKCSIEGGIRSFKSTNDAYDFISSSKVEGKTILIKGSRGLKLERLVEKL